MRGRRPSHRASPLPPPRGNLGFVATPAGSVTETELSLARELNVGLLRVRDGTTAELLEPVRVTGGGEFSTDIEAVRLQASSRRLTEWSFPLNHPKNYLGYAFVLAAGSDTEATFADHVVEAFRGSRRGAIQLDLVEDRPDGEDLTHLGREVVRFACEQCGGTEAALRVFDEWTGSDECFTEFAPRWPQLARAVTMQYHPPGSSSAPLSSCTPTASGRPRCHSTSDGPVS